MASVSTASVDWSQGTVLLQGGQLYCSPNCNRVVTIPDPKLARTSPFQSLLSKPQITLNHPVWWDYSHGWLSFVPLAPTFLSLPFEPLCWKPRVVEYHVRPGANIRYMIHSDDSFSWGQREEALSRMANELRLMYHIPGTVPPLPSSCGLYESHATRSDLERSVTECRRWFAIWMGFVSYLIAQTYRPTFHRPSSGPLPGWHQHLLEKNINAPWLNGLTGSSVCDFSSRNIRAGVIIAFDELDPIRPPAEWFITHHIPLWYPLTRHTEYYLRKDGFMCKLLPPNDMVERALEDLLGEPRLVLSVLKGYVGFAWNELRVETSRLLDLKDSSSVVWDICSKRIILPSVQSCIISWDKPEERDQIMREISSKLVQRETAMLTKISAQVPQDQGMVDRDMFEGLTTLHQDWRDFFAKRDSREAELLASESDKDKNARMQREKQRPTGKCRMFTWERVCTTAGSFIYARTLAKKSSHSSLVEHYGPQETKFYARYSEWDFFEEFGFNNCTTPLASSAGPAAGVETDGYPEDTEAEQQSLEAPPKPDDMYANHTVYAPAIAPETFETTAVVEDYPPQTLGSPVDAPRTHDDRIIERAIWQFGYVPTFGKMFMDGPDTIPWKEVVHIVGCADKEAQVDGPNMLAMRIFFTALVQQTPAPYELDDLSTDCHSFLLSQIGLESFTYLQKKWYVFHAPRSKNCTWHLGVDSPATVLYILRVLSTYKQHTIFTLAAHLVSKGVRFRTLEYLPKVPSHSPILLPFKPSSYREQGYKFTGQDFFTALLQARNVLFTLPGRAALGFGGIIARIAREYVDPDVLLDGPSTEATFARHGFCLDTANGEGQFWDDDLSDHELAIICGTYVMYTGSGIQTTTVSWFPPPQAWTGNSYDSLEWTPMAEHIFQDIFSNARLGRFQPLSTKRWRDRLRGFKLPRVAQTSNAQRAANFLGGQDLEFA